MEKFSINPDASPSKKGLPKRIIVDDADMSDPDEEYRRVNESNK